MSLNNLNDYQVQRLKRFCEERGLTVKDADELIELVQWIIEERIELSRPYRSSF